MRKQSGNEWPGPDRRIPPLDETVVSLKLVTPGKGTIELSEEMDPETFRMARCGVGSMGVAAEVTLQCVKAGSRVQGFEGGYS